MPENETTETQNVQAQGAETTTPAETRREKFEREQMNRRAALKKMGVTTAMSVFAMFSVDDLARMVGKAMEQRAKDNQVAEVVARELRGAGVAMAGYGSKSPCSGCVSGDQDCHPKPGQKCLPCCGGCSCVQATDVPCGPGGGSNSLKPGSTDYNFCQACCRYRNPSASDPGDFGFSGCKSAGGCV